MENITIFHVPPIITPEKNQDGSEISNRGFNFISKIDIARVFKIFCLIHKSIYIYIYNDIIWILCNSYGLNDRF